MKRYFSVIQIIAIATVAALALSSCDKGKKTNVEVLPVMDKALNQPSSVWYADFDVFPQNMDRSQLPIGVFDSGTGGLTVLEVILGADYLDNIEGDAGPDGIPDFHGEDFQYLADQANMPYGTYSSEGKADYLRELAVKDALFLLGDKYYKLPTDKSAKGTKSRCKILVIACNTATAYGLNDIKNLLDLSGTGVRVIGVINAGVNAAFEDIASSKERDSLSIGVMATIGTIDSDAYRRTIEEVKKARNYPGFVQVVNQKGAGFAEAVDLEKDYVDLSLTAPRDSYRGPSLGEGEDDIKEELLPVYNFCFKDGGVLYKKENGKYTQFQLNSAANYARFHLVSLLEKVRQSKEQAPLKSVILGCTHYPFLLDTLKQTLKELKEYKKNGMYIYSHLIAEDFTFIDPAVFTAIECCKALREDKLMALRTRRGNVDAYISVPYYRVDPKYLEKDGGLTREFKYGRFPGTEDITTVPVPFSKENLNPDNLKRIQKLVPYTYEKIKEKL
ncbi:MAG: aspartate/glutamate racemase family protein [Bacteroidales bacterium]|nr:aspartate/glutamate racemase family protein [Bacteroidales bacterium]